LTNNLQIDRATLIGQFAAARGAHPTLAAAPIKARQACFRPATEDGLPLMVRPGVNGAYEATGHARRRQARPTFIKAARMYRRSQSRSICSF
jgi:hypothetical protein